MSALESAADLEHALRRNAELEQKIQQMGAEARAWQGVAGSHEAVAAGLRATLDQLLQEAPPRAEGVGEAEDARSCCFERGCDDASPSGAGGGRTTRACRSCGEAGACVLQNHVHRASAGQATRE